MTIEIPQHAQEIPGFSGYFISRYGQVWSTRRNRVTCLSPMRHTYGYHVVNLYHDGERHAQYVHRLVLLTFDRPSEEGEMCRHLDGDPSNNHIDNLKWGTSKENQLDRVRHGTDCRGSDHYNAKLTEDQVFEIRCLCEREPLERGTISEAFSVSKELVTQIANGLIWTHVGGPISGVDYHAPTPSDVTYGERNGNSKLTERQVIEIRERYATGYETYKSLAADYPIGSSMVEFIIKGTNWEDTPGPIKGRDY